MDGLGGGFATIQVTDHSWKEMVNDLDVTSSGMLGLQALVGGVFRGDGNVKGKVNSSALITSTPPFIRAGNNGQFLLGIGSATPISIPALITAVHYQGAVAGTVDYDFDIKLNILAGTGIYGQAT